MGQGHRQAHTEPRARVSPPRQSPNLGALAPVGLGGASSSGGQCRGHPGIYPVSLLPFGSHSHRSGSEKAGGMPEWARPFPPLPREATGSPGKTCLSQAKKPRQRSRRSAKQAGPTCALGPLSRQTGGDLVLLGRGEAGKKAESQSTGRHTVAVAEAEQDHPPLSRSCPMSCEAETSPW